MKSGVARGAKYRALLRGEYVYSSIRRTLRNILTYFRVLLHCCTTAYRVLATAERLKDTLRTRLLSVAGLKNERGNRASSGPLFQYATERPN